MRMRTAQIDAANALKVLLPLGMALVLLNALGFIDAAWWLVTLPLWILPALVSTILLECLLLWGILELAGLFGRRS